MIIINLERINTYAEFSCRSISILRVFGKKKYENIKKVGDKNI